MGSILRESWKSEQKDAFMFIVPKEAPGRALPSIQT